MRKLYARIFSIFCMALFGLTANAQVSAYTFTQTSGTYTAITGGTVHASTSTAWDDNVYSGTIGFSFTFNGTSYTTVNINSNGYITFGATAPSTTNYTPVSSTAGYSGAVAAFARDLIANTANNSEIRSETIGSAPNRTYVVQWTNARRYSGGAVTGDVLNFQIRLQETTNSIQIVYGTNTATSTTSYTSQLGLRGATNADFNNRTSTTTWSATTAGATNGATITSSNTIMPASGQTYTWALPVAQPIDLAGVSVNGLTGCGTAAVPLNMTIRNNGTSTLDFATTPVTVTINITGAATQTLTGTLNSGTLAPNATTIVVANPAANLSAAGNYSVTGTVTITGDGNAANNTTAAATFTTLPIATSPWSESFATTSTPAGWNIGSWTIGATHGRTTNGIYLNLYSGVTTGQFRTLPIGPIGANDAISFDYRVVDFSGYPSTATTGNWGNYKVQVSTDCGATFTDLATVDNSNHTSSLNWATRTYSLGAYAGQNVMIRILATWTTGDWYLDFDNFSIAPTCSGTPSAPTTVASTTTACYGGGTVSLSLSGGSAGGTGITYQWQSSPDGTTWSPIAGATASTYTANVTTATWYRAVLTCTNGGATANATPVQITIGAPGSVPYTESFESITTANTLPNCMTATSLGSLVYTYTAATGSYNQAARTGSKFASFRYNPGATGQWIWTPSLNLTAGVAYKFSVWYVTDGASGFDAIRASYGTSPTAAAMTNLIVQQANPTNTTYQELTSVFTPATTGVYNIGIQVTGTSFSPWYVTVDDISVTALPGCAGAPTAGTVTTTGSLPICVGSSATLNLTGASSGTGITYQWQSSPNNSAWANIAGQTGTSLTVSPTANTWYRVVVTCTNTSSVSNTAGVQITVNNPSITGTTPGSRCGVGTVNLTATGAAGTTINWYTSATGGNPVGTGTSFTTPSIGATTTYYAEAAFVNGPFSIGQASDVAANLSSLGGYGMYFSTTSAATIHTVQIYPSTAGTLNVTLRNAANTVVDTRSFTITAADISTTTPKTLALNFAVPAGSTGWQIFYDLSINRGAGTYPYGVSNAGFTITGNTLDGNNITSGTRYYFYNWSVSTLCASTRTAVTATVTAAPAISVLPGSANICQGQNQTLAVSSANTGYTYSWTPGGQTGSPITVSPTSTTSYVVTATDNSGGTNNGCVTKDSVLVTVNPLPGAVTITPASASICANTVQQLTANGGLTQSTVNLASGTLSLSVPDASATGVYDSLLVAGIPAGATIDSVVVSFNVTQTYLADMELNLQAPNGQIINLVADQGGASGLGFVNTRVTSNGSAAAFSTGSAPFTGTFKADAAPQSQLIGAPAVTTQTFSDLFANPNGYWKLRAYDDAGGDNGVLTGWTIKIAYTAPAPITWSPVTNLFSNAAATTAYVAGTPAASVWTKTAATSTYTATATNAFGCTSTQSVTINISQPPAITQQPTNQIGCTGGTATFSVGATGAGLTYQWQYNGTNIAGATGATYSIPNATAANNGNYAVVVSGTCPSPVTSNTVTLTVGDNSWVGASNTDWNNPLNWCGGVPTSTVNVTIPAGTPFAPVITANANVNNLIVSSGANLTVTANGRLGVSGNITNAGTLNTTAGTLEFRGASNQNVPALNAAYVILNGAGGITLGGNLTVGTGLTLTNGNITLGTNNLTMTGGATGSAASHIVTNGTGRVTANNVGAVSVVFPVGSTATNYNPVTIANGQALNYTVGVSTGITPAIANGAAAINRTWNITSSGTPASPVTVSLQYADADVNASGSATGNKEVGVYNGSTWLTVSPSGGIAPFGAASPRTVSYQTIAFGPTVLGNVGSVNFPLAVPNVDSDITGVQLMPNVVNNRTVLRINSRRTTNIDFQVVDGNGRVVLSFRQKVFAGQNDYPMNLGRLAAGTYQLVGQTDKGKVSATRFVRL